MKKLLKSNSHLTRCRIQFHDVIFFLTDGRISGQQALDIIQMNNRSKNVVINTIAFDNNESQVLLEELAKKSGGLFRFVPVRAAR